MPDLTVREVTEGDEQEILLIRNNPLNYKWFFNDLPILSKAHHEWLSGRILHSQFFTLVAEREGSVVGIAYLNLSPNSSPLVSINISPDYGHSGIGTTLLNELKYRSKQRGIESLTAVIKESNVASIEFFLKNGFIHENMLSKFIEKIEQEVVVLSFNLNL